MFVCARCANNTILGKKMNFVSILSSITYLLSFTKKKQYHSFLAGGGTWAMPTSGSDSKMALIPKQRCHLGGRELD